MSLCEQNMDVGLKLLIEFATDTMKFVLAMSGYGYDGLFERREEWIPDTFEYVFGQAVFYYRQSHLDRFEDMIQSYHDLIFQDEATILNYLKYGVKQLAKGDSILMDLLRILAFYADFIIYSQRFDNRKEIVAVVIKHFSEIYNHAGVRDLLQNCGSYGFLRMAAEEIIGPRAHEISFVERMTRYRQLLQKGSPDRRRVSFSLPDENEKNASRLTSSPETGRLESCLSMFTNMSSNHSRENGFLEENIHLESTACSSNMDLNAPSTSGTNVQPVNSPDSEGEECEHLKKKSTSEFKPQSILKSPHGIKGHKRTASDETASNKTKRSRTDESAGKIESHPGEEDPNISTLGLLIHIPDFISEELRVSLDNISEEIMNYNKTRTGPDVYDEDLESPPKLPEESKHAESDKDSPKDSDFSPKDESILNEAAKMDTGSPSKNLETTVEEAKKREKIVKENTSAVTAGTGETSAVEIFPATSSIRSNNQTVFMEIDSVVRGGISSEGSKSGVSDSLIVEASDDSQYSSMSEDSNNQNESARINIVSNFNERSEYSVTSIVQLEDSQEIKTGNNSNPETNPVEIRPNVSHVLHDNQTKCKEFEMTVGDYGLHYEFAESIELGASVEVVTSIESDHKPDTTEAVKTEICEKVDSCDTPIAATDPETGENKPDNLVKDVSSEDSDHSNAQNKPDRKDSVSDTSAPFGNPETNLRPSEECKQTENDCADTSCRNIDDSGKTSTIIISPSEACTPKDSDIASDETKIICTESSELSKSIVTKPGDSSETASSGDDSECRLDAPEDVESGKDEVKIDLNNRDKSCEIPETNVCEPCDSQTANSDNTKCPDSNKDTDTINKPVKTCIDTDSSVNNENMDCDQVEIGNSDTCEVKDSD